MIDLSVVIVTWNQEEKLKKCLASVYQTKRDLEFEVIVIDNNSQDKTWEVLGQFPGVRKIRNDNNLGVAPARNQGIKLARGKYIMMLDDDTEVYPDCFEKVVSFMERYPDCWCAGTKTLNARGELEYSARTFYTLPTVLFRRTWLGALFPNNRFVRRHLMVEWDHNSPREVDWVAGASFVMRREAVEETGPFDEAYFFGFEDADWCYRVHLSGKKVHYINDAIIVHHIQQTSRRIFSKKAFPHFRSALRFYYKIFLRKHLS